MSNIDLPEQDPPSVTAGYAGGEPVAYWYQRATVITGSGLPALWQNELTFGKPDTHEFIRNVCPLYATPQQSSAPDAWQEALEFYADPSNWIDTPPWDGDPGCITRKAIPVTKEDGRPCDCGDRARAALSSPQQAPQSAGQNSADHPYSENWKEFMGDETGWVIEKDDPPVYHLVSDDYDEHWTSDVDKAIRFARKEDAQAYANHIGWTSPPVRIAEHMWVAPRAASSSRSPGECATAEDLRAAYDEYCFVTGPKDELKWKSPTQVVIQAILQKFDVRRRGLAMTHRDATQALAPCEYCGNGKRTGLPSNACENCMNTGYKYPDRAELALAAAELAKIPPNVYWVLAKGRTRPDEPLWGARITDLDGNIIAETEGDHPADIVRHICALLHEE